MEKKKQQHSSVKIDVPSEHMDSTGSVTERCLPGFGTSAFRTCVPLPAVVGVRSIGNSVFRL